MDVLNIVVDVSLIRVVWLNKVCFNVLRDMGDLVNEMIMMLRILRKIKLFVI